MKNIVKSVKNLIYTNQNSSIDAISRRILVSSNCQTGGLSAALQVLLPEDRVIPLPLPNFSNENDELKFIEKLNGTDVWITIGQYHLLEKHKVNDRIQIVKIPRIRIAAFHPDLIYLRRTSTNELVDPHYNSAIAAWAYKNNFDVSDTLKLFNGRIYAELGYLNSWATGTAALKQIFDETDIDFTEFILGARREGLFMYSLNHPKVQVLVRLAKLIALRIGADKSVMDKAVDINDGLNDVIWPLYPEIGDGFAIPSTYEWKFGQVKWIKGLKTYLEFAFNNYSEQKIPRDDISLVGVDERLYERVLGGQLGVNHD